MNKQRIQVIDALRGFALAGVALVHVIEQYVGGPVPGGGIANANEGTLDGIVSGFVGIFFFGKFFALFSILFGLSFYIMMKSAEDRGESFAGRFLWRAALLMGFGFIHQCFYRGDILTIYASLVPFLIPFYKVKSKWVLVVASLCFFSIFKILSFAIFADQPIFAPIAPMDVENSANYDYIDLIENGSFAALAWSNLTFGMLTKMDFQLGAMGRYFPTLGYFLIGMLLGRIGLFKDLDAFVKYRKKALLYTLLFFVVGIILTAAFFSQAPQPMDWTSWWSALGLNFSEWPNMAIMVFILIGFLSWYRTERGGRLLSVFAPYGRMALTNYVLQSVLGTYLLFNWGLDYFATFHNYQLFLIAIAIIALQIVFSRYWLNNFKYGPLEWLWRSLTYLKWQPMRK